MLPASRSGWAEFISSRKAFQVSQRQEPPRLRALCLCGLGRCCKSRAAPGAAGSWRLPCFQPHFPSEGWAQHGTALRRVRRLFTFIHVSWTSPSGVRQLFVCFVLFVTTARGINLIRTLNVYGPEPPRTTVFQTPWPASRRLLYNPRDDRQRALRTPSPSCQTTRPGLFPALLALLAFALPWQWTLVDSGSSQVGRGGGAVRVEVRKIPWDRPRPTWGHSGQTWHTIRWKFNSRNLEKTSTPETIFKEN